MRACGRCKVIGGPGGEPSDAFELNSVRSRNGCTCARSICYVVNGGVRMVKVSDIVTNHMLKGHNKGNVASLSEGMNSHTLVKSLNRKLARCLVHV